MMLAVRLLLSLFFAFNAKADPTLEIPLDEYSKYTFQAAVSEASNRTLGLQVSLVDRDPKPDTGNRQATESIYESLNFRADGKIVNKASDGQRGFHLEVPQGTKILDIYVSRRHVGRIQLDAATGKMRWQPLSRLTSFDIRMFGKKGGAYAAQIPAGLTGKEIREFRTPMDLHTHFGGALRSEEIIRIAFKHQMPFPTALLKELGVVIPEEFKDKPTLPFTPENISESTVKKLKDVLDLPKTEVTTLERMELSYKFRGPLVKHKAALVDFLESLILDYKRNGVKYALSAVSDAARPEWLAEAQKYLPELERKHGVKLRFLVALWRHSPEQFNRDILARVEALIGSPYIVGIDVMGHETNSTAAFEGIIKEARRIFDSRGLTEAVIRVHAGENPFYPGNVREAVDAGANQIGHGLYGIDEKTLATLKKYNAPVEINIGSNVALNNAVNAEDIPIRQYIERGIPVTFGSDGHGLYNETPSSQLYGALYAGVSPEDLATIVQQSHEYIERKEAEFQKRLAANPTLALPETMPEPKFKDSDWKLENDRKALQKKDIESRLRKLGIEPHESLAKFAETVKGMTPITISGASMFSYEQIALKDRAEILRSIRELIHHADPRTTYFATGGSDYGVEKILHDEVLYFNTEARKKGQPEFRLVGQLVAENRGTLYALGALTDAVIAAPWWFERAAASVSYASEHKGLILYFGGGNIVADEIQSARNANVDFFTAKGPAGASDKAADLYPDRAFSSSAELIKMLQARRPELLTPAARRLPVGRRAWTEKQKIHFTTKEDAIKIIRAKGKPVITIAGFSAQGYEDKEGFKAAVISELRQLDKSKVLINAGANDAGVGEAADIAKAMGFGTVGIVSAASGDARTFSRTVDEVFVIEDGLKGGYDKKAGTVSATSEVLVTVSSKYIALGGGRITGMESQLFEDAGKPTVYREFKTSPEKSVANFIKRQRIQTQKKLQGRDKEFSDGSVDLALKTIAEALYQGSPVDEAVIAEGKRRIVADTASMYDLGDTDAFAGRVMNAAIEQLNSLDAGDLASFFSQYGMARQMINERRSSAGGSCKDPHR